MSKYLRYLALAAVGILAHMHPAHATIKLAAFGDSLMAGYGLAAADGFTQQLQGHLRAQGLDVEIVNVAISGDTTADGLNRVKPVLKDRPDGVLLGLGSNDALRRLDHVQAYRNLDRIVTAFKEAGIPVMIVGAQAPLNWGLSYKLGFDAIFPKLARDHGLKLYPFILEGVALNPQLNQSDGVHPNRAGVQIMVRNMSPKIIEFVDSFKGR